VDARGVPLSLVVSGANLHDCKGLEPVLDSVRIEDVRAPKCRRGDNLCADRGYDYPFARKLVTAKGYRPHIRSRQEEKKRRIQKRGRPRRWVVEACHSWLNRFRKVLVRFEKTLAGALGLLELACAIICWRRVADV
jgi:transposase